MRRFSVLTIILVITAIVAAALAFLPAFDDALVDLTDTQLHTSSSTLSTDQSTSTEGSDALRFAIVSDTETEQVTITSTFRHLVDEMSDEDVDFAIHLGDFSHRADRSTYEEFQSFTETTRFPWHIVPGNHDLLQPGSTSGRDYDDSLFVEMFEKTYSSFLADPQTLVVLLNNADNTKGFDAEQLTFLEKQLQLGVSPNPVSDIKRVIVGMHRPVKVPNAESLGVYDGTAGEADASYDRFEEILSASPEDLNIHLFAGHVHTTFTYELAGNPVIVTGGGGSDLNVSGFAGASFPHWYLVEISDGELSSSIQALQ